MTALNYTAGTVSLTNGSAVVTGVGTAWQIALIVGGTIYVEAAGNPLPIDSVDSDTQITAAIAWAGATGAYNYVLRRSTTYDEQVAKNAEIFARLVAELEAGTIWKYDASGDTAGRAFYDTRPKGFSYLDVSGEQPALWIKASNDEADWAGPFSYGVGPVGPAPSLTFSPVTTGDPGTPASVDVTGSGPYNLAFTVPAGLTGIRWRGAYDAGTSYLERDGVRDNGSTWIALQDSIGNAPPVLPTTANAFWELVAAKGLDGTGTGDVVGPAGAVDGRLAVFSGTSGKLIAVGPAPFSGAYGDLSGLPTLGGAAALDVGNTAGTVAAGDDPRFSVGGKNDAVFALEIADLKGVRLGMIGGIADAFDDETGVATKTNATYDSVNDRYTSMDQSNAAPPNGSAAATNYTIFNRAVVLTGGKTVKAFRFSQTLAGTYSIKIAERTGAGSYNVVYAQTVVHLGGGDATFALTSPYSVPESGVYHFGVFTATAGVASLIDASVRAYKSGDAPVGAASGFTEDSAQAYSVGAVYGNLNMTLASVIYAAAVVPTSARLAVQVAENEAIAINTDLTAEVSRDGGTTWTTGTLALSTNLNGMKIYEASDIDISGQPSGTSMKWRVKTLNNKNVDVSGVVMQWS